MNVNDIAKTAGIELSDIVARTDEKQIESLMECIQNAKKIYVCGAGRSLLMLRCFAMRLMHIGYDAYVVGDTTTPAFEADDLLIVGSGSGETKNLISIAKRAKEYGGKVALVSIFPDSTLGSIADCTIKIPAYTDKLPESDDNKKNVLPGGSMFEISMIVLSDSMIIPLAEKKQTATDKAFDRHANLE